jgi:hypothetical protein
MQDNINNKSTTGLDVPAFANVLPVLVSAKHPHLNNVGAESTTHCTNQDCTNQDSNTGGIKRPKKERLPRTNLGLFHAKPGSDQGLFPRLRGKPPCNKFCIQGRVCDKLCQICKFAHMSRAGRCLKRTTKWPSLNMPTRPVISGLTRRPSRTKRPRFPRNTSISRAMQMAPSPSLQRVRKNLAGDCRLHILYSFETCD